MGNYLANYNKIPISAQKSPKLVLENVRFGIYVILPISVVAFLHIPGSSDWIVQKWSFIEARPEKGRTELNYIKQLAREQKQNDEKNLSITTSKEKSSL